MDEAHYIEQVKYLKQLQHELLKYENMAEELRHEINELEDELKSAPPFLRRALRDPEEILFKRQSPTHN